VVTLPVEVVGPDGSSNSATVDVPPAQAAQVRSLWMQIHNLAYADMVSVQLNDAAWMTLNNETVAVAEPGKSYGGIGGGFSTLKVTLALTAGMVQPGSNTLRFRLNHTDGAVSGFRVLAFNFLTGESTKVLPPDTFREDDPNAWTPPLTDPASLSAGRQLWENGPLTANSFRDAGPIRAHCADCHARDGRDLKYFSYSNESIIARSVFHGLTELQGRQIASYIRTVDAPSPGRPWNPPYQPGPGLDAKPVANWAAGAGIDWALDNDSETLSYIFVADSELAGRAIRGPRNAFRPDGNLNPREIPIALQLPDWSHWLPRVHPLDAWGPAFQKSEFASLYEKFRSTLAAKDLAAAISSGRVATQFESWTATRRALLKPFVEQTRVKWTADLANKAYSTELWQLVKSWEMAQEFDLEKRGREYYGPDGESRTWFNSIPEATAPAAVGIPSGPNGMGGSALTNEYFNSAWYELQVLLNSGNHRHKDRTPVDWLYVIGSFQDLYRVTRKPEPARLLITMIKSLQSTDARVGPEFVDRGWRPARNVDPAIMVHDRWAPIFQPIPAEVRRAITESFILAWLEKNRQFALDRYFRGGSERSYTLPTNLEGVIGGDIGDAAPQFARVGISADIISQVKKWSADLADVAARFQYAPTIKRP